MHYAAPLRSCENVYYFANDALQSQRATIWNPDHSRLVRRGYDGPHYHRVHEARRQDDM
jgi:hypothetical protein